MSFGMLILRRQIVYSGRLFYSTSSKTTPAKETAGELIKRTLEEIKRQPIDPKARDAALKKLLKDAQQIDPNTVGASERFIDRVAVAIHSASTKG
jgi:hypothetical protein